MHGHVAHGGFESLHKSASGFGVVFRATAIPTAKKHCKLRGYIKGEAVDSGPLHKIASDFGVVFLATPSYSKKAL